jgi:hypothetical protein
MTLPTAQHAVVDLQHAHRELLRVVDSLSSADWERGVPYGEWTVKDLIAHLVGDLSPSGAGLIYAGVLNEQFIADTSRFFDVRGRNQATVDDRRRWTREDLRQVLFEAHDARIEMTLRLDERHVDILELPVPMGPEYELKVEDWLWYGYHDREHTDDIRRAMKMDWTPRTLTFLPELDETMRQMVRHREGLLRAIYSVDADAWDAPAYAEPGWTYRDVLAHVATNDLRPQTRIRRVLGERDDEAMAALLRTDEWNAARVAGLEGKTVAEVIDAMQANRNVLLELVAQLERKHLTETVTFSDGSTFPLSEYLGFIGRHDSNHAAHLVPASSRARVHAK